MTDLYIIILGSNPRGEQLYYLMEHPRGKVLGVDTRGRVNQFIAQNKHKYEEIVDEELFNLRMAQLKMEAKKIQNEIQRNIKIK